MHLQKKQGGSILNGINQIVSFECPICMEEYDDKNKYPMIVCPLQHCICRNCIATVIFVKAKQNKCPECRSAIYKDKIIEFRYLIMMKKLSDEYKQKNKPIKQVIEKIPNGDIKNKDKNIGTSVVRRKEQQIKIYKSQLTQKQKIIKKLEQQNKKLHQNRLKTENNHPAKQRCNNNHDLVQKTDLPYPPYKNNQYKCDGCRLSYRAHKQTKVWHCSFCNFDLCNQCYLGTNKSEFKCNNNHTLLILSKLTNTSASYPNNRFKCDRCMVSNQASSQNQIWHCGHCLYDLCKNCVDKIKKQIITSKNKLK